MKNALTGVERALFWTLAVRRLRGGGRRPGRAGGRSCGGQATNRRGRNYAIVRVLAPEGPAGMAAAEAALDRRPARRPAPRR